MTKFMPGGSRLSAVVAATILVSACTGAPTPAPTSPRGTPEQTTAPAEATCVVDPHGRPTSCKALFGISLRPLDGESLAAAERQAGRRFDLVYRFHDLGSEFPDQSERDAIGRGQVLHMSIASRKFGGDDVAYARVIAGEFDESLRRQAEGARGIGKPVFITFEQEGNQPDKAGTRGTAAEYVAAWCHVRDIFATAGATNVVWVWVMMGDPKFTARAGELWPGNDVVDWISWNVYNPSGCRSGKVNPTAYQSFEAGVKGFYDWVHTDGAKLGIDATKPMMISESGSVPYADDMARTAQWYADIPATVAKYPQIQAVSLWSGLDATGAKQCDYRWQNDDVVAQGVAKAGAGLR